MPDDFSSGHASAERSSAGSPASDPRTAGEQDPQAPSGNDASDARYLVAARKYRPALFRQLVAQEHVTDTLKNALRLDRLAHAYLFSGPRGVGKTTAARILAKAINCTTPLEEREDEAEPCRECESCRSFEAGRSLGIFELDAASNNKVDDIRELRETVRVPPQGAKRKVYIIDEVHMLSNQAFNALLKTLEEPPPHVLFIFATTEPHKVLPTILSRCQRFDFRRIRAGRIAQHLQWICDEEGIDADEGSLMLLARKGDGALRDALSAFDQAVSLCGDVLRYDELAQAMGVVDADLYFHATEHVREGQSGGMLRLVEDVVGRGYDLQEFLTGLSEHLRNLMVACTMEDASLIEATDAMRRRYTQSARHFSEDDLLRLLMIAGEAEEAVKQSAQPRLRLEMALLKMAALPRAADLQEALSTLRRLEKMAHDGQLAELPAGVSSSSVSASDATSSDDTSAPSASTPAPDTDVSEEALPGRSSSAKESVEDASSSGRGGADSSEKATADPSSATYETAEEKGASGEVHEPSPGTSDEPRAAGDESRAEEEEASREASDDESEDEGVTFANLNPDASPSEEEQASGSAVSADASSSASSPQEDSSPPPEYDDLFGPPALSASEQSSGGETENARGGDGSARADGGAPSAALSSSEGGVATAPALPSGRVSEPEPFSAEQDPAVKRLRQRWDRLVHDVRSDRIDLASCLSDARPTDLSAGTLTVAVPNQFSRRFLRDQESFLLRHVEQHLPEGTTVPSSLQLTIEEASSEEEADEDGLPDPHAVMQRMREEHPVVKAIFEEFGGEMAW